MTARVAAGVSALLGIIVLTTAPAAQRGGPAGKRGGPPAFASADRFDVSRALRDMPRLPPRPAGPKHEAPRFRRIVGPRSFDPIVQSSPLPLLLSEPAVSFEGIGNVNGVLPPDTNGDAGPNHYVQWVNLAFAVYAKGAPGSTPTLVYGPAAGNSLWTGFGGPCETTNNGDPVVRYDHLADRWVMSQLALPNAFFGIYFFPPFYQCIAVSATPDPTGPYYRYQYSFSKLNDYPKFGVWPDAYYMTMNQFAPPFLNWAGQGVVAFDRAKMLIGQPAGMVHFDLAPVDMNLGGMLPSDLDGPPPPAGAANYFMQVDDDAWGYAPDQLQVWRFQVDWAAPANSTFTHVASLPTAPFDSNLCALGENCIPQPGVSAKLSPLSDRLMYRLQYRNFGTHESLVVNHTVDVDGSDHAGIRWYEIRDPQAPSIYQQGSYAPDADHRWMGSAAMDAAGNLAIGFSVSGQATSPSVRFAGRLANDPLGMLAQGETTLIAGSGSQTNGSGRWGDYSMLSVDPADDCTFWYTQQYYADTTDAGWRTRIGAFSLPPCTAPPSSDLPRASVAATTSTALEAGASSAVFTVSRTNDAADPLTVAYTVAGTATPGADYVALPGVVTVPAGAASVPIAVAPIDDALVEPNETIMLTLSQAPSYLVGASGTAVVTLVSDDVPPDFVVTALTAPAVGGANAAMTVSDTTRNQGSGAAPASVTAFRLSRDSVVSADDAVIGTREVPPLPAGASSAAATTAMVPPGTATGTYFVIAVADPALSVAESSETNNTRVSALVRIGPDLTTSGTTVSPTGAAGGTIVVGETTRNQGGGAAAASATGFYLSPSTVFGPAARLIGTRAVPPLAAGGTSTASTPLTVPADVATGSYFIITSADQPAVVAETFENNNNGFAVLVRIGPDLIVAAVSPPSSVVAGASAVVNSTVRNQGGGAAGGSTIRFYLSANLTIDASDVLVGSRPVSPLAAGQTDAGPATITVPAGTRAGSYNLIAVVDEPGSVTETIETNNTRVALLIVSAGAAP